MKFLLSAFVEIVRAGALLLAAGCALLALAAQGGRFSNKLDALTHLTPLFLVGAVAAGLVWLLAGRKGLITPVLAGAAIISGLVLIWPELSAKRVFASPETTTLKLVQFNTWVRNSDPERSAAWILEQDPDIVVLEEATRDPGVVQLLADRYPHRTTCDEPIPCSTLIMAKRKPIAEGGLSGPQRANLMGAWATYSSSAGDFTVVGVHYTWPWPAGPQQMQTKRLAKVLDRFPKDRLIVAGDFNSTPWSFSLQRQDALFGLERRTHGLFSWPAAPISRLNIALPFPVLAIDQIYAGEAWRTVSVKRGPKLGSDHYPVVIKLAHVSAR